MNRDLEDNRMDAPIVRDSISMFSLEFRRRVLSPSSSFSRDEIILFISANEPCSASEISEGLGIPRSTVTYRLKKLVNAGELKRIGPERSRSQKYRLA